MIPDEILKDLFKKISKPRCKTALVDCLGLTVGELLLLLDLHVPQQHLIHERGGQVQLVKVDSTRCRYIGAKGQCQWRPKYSSRFCGHHRSLGTISSQFQELALYIHKRGIPKSWEQDKETRRIRNMVICQRSPRTKEDKQLLALVASLQKKVVNGEPADAEEEKLRTIIRQLNLTKPKDSYEQQAIQFRVVCTPLVLCEEDERSSNNPKVCSPTQ